MFVYLKHRNASKYITLPNNITTIEQLIKLNNTIK